MNCHHTFNGYSRERRILGPVSTVWMSGFIPTHVGVAVSNSRQIAFLYQCISTVMSFDNVCLYPQQ